MNMFNNIMGTVTKLTGTGKNENKNITSSTGTTNMTEVQILKEKLSKLEEENKLVKQMLLSDVEDNSKINKIFTDIKSVLFFNEKNDDLNKSILEFKKFLSEQILFYGLQEDDIDNLNNLTNTLNDYDWSQNKDLFMFKQRLLENNFNEMFRNLVIMNKFKDNKPVSKGNSGLIGNSVSIMNSLSIGNTIVRTETSTSNKNLNVESKYSGSNINEKNSSNNNNDNTNNNNLTNNNSNFTNNDKYSNNNNTNNNNLTNNNSNFTNNDKYSSVSNNPTSVSYDKFIDKSNDKYSSVGSSSNEIQDNNSNKYNQQIFSNQVTDNLNNQNPFTSTSNNNNVNDNNSFKQNVILNNIEVKTTKLNYPTYPAKQEKKEEVNAFDKLLDVDIDNSTKFTNTNTNTNKNIDNTTNVKTDVLKPNPTTKKVDTKQPSLISPTNKKSEKTVEDTSGKKKLDKNSINFDNLLGDIDLGDDFSAINSANPKIVKKSSLETNNQFMNSSSVTGGGLKKKKTKWEDEEEEEEN